MAAKWWGSGSGGDGGVAAVNILLTPASSAPCSCPLLWVLTPSSLRDSGGGWVGDAPQTRSLQVTDTPSYSHNSPPPDAVMSAEES